MIGPFSPVWSPLLLLLVLAFVPPASAQDGPLPALESCMGFVTNQGIGVELFALQAEHPDLARAFSIGTTLEGREIWALLVSTDPDVEAAEPEVRIVGGIHGDECISVDLVLEAARWLVTDVESDPDVVAIVGGTQVLIVPSVNPDGRARLLASRTNAANVDLNRNMGFGWVGARDGAAGGPHPFSEPETLALRDLGEQRTFVLGLSFHTRASFVNGPWNYTPHRTGDAALIAEIGGAYAGDTGYEAGFGWDWYAINGDLNDWSLGTRGTFDWTIELRSDLFGEWDIHREALRRFLAFAHRGIRGVVTDARTGEPLAARIEIGAENAPIFTDGVIGDYHRMALAGRYAVTAVSQGYDAQTVTGVVVGDSGAVDVDFSLEPSPDGSPEHGFAITQMILPEPISNDRYGDVQYLNRTWAWAALGPPDGVFYSLSPGGSITIDLGLGFGALDAPGDDLTVVSGTQSEDPVIVLVSVEQDGLFIEVAEGSGTFGVDIAAGGATEARFVRLVDDGEGPFNDERAGFDLDAIVNLSPRPRPGAPTGDDAGIDADAPRPTEDADVSDAEVSSSDAGDGGSVVEDGDDRGTGCGCRAVAIRRGLSFPLGFASTL